MFTIGEFSRISGLSVKTLRFYHERGILTPACVDDQTGYRYYDQPQAERARLIAELRSMEFSLEDIKEILHDEQDQVDVLELLERHKTLLEERVRRYRKAVSALQAIIVQEREATAMMTGSAFEVEEKVLEPVLAAGIRMKGRYSECGKAFGKIARAYGRHLAGKCFLLHYDSEYQEDADFQACFPVRQAKNVDGITVAELPGGPCFTLLHKGPYEQIGRSYAKILGYIKAKGFELVLPTREVYVKGPGMILKGNPNNYLTEIQMLVRDQSGSAAAV